MNNILVIGSGVMGNGIAELLSINGIKTTITDTSVKSLNQSKRKILFDTYTEIFSSFKESLNLKFIEIPKYAKGNIHAFWVLLKSP